MSTPSLYTARKPALTSAGVASCCNPSGDKVEWIASWLARSMSMCRGAVLSEFVVHNGSSLTGLVTVYDELGTA